MYFVAARLGSVDTLSSDFLVLQARMWFRDAIPRIQRAIPALGSEFLELAKVKTKPVPVSRNSCQQIRNSREKGMMPTIAARALVKR